MRCGGRLQCVVNRLTLGRGLTELASQSTGRDRNGAGSWGGGERKDRKEGEEESMVISSS